MRIKERVSMMRWSNIALGYCILSMGPAGKWSINLPLACKMDYYPATSKSHHYDYNWLPKLKSW